MKTEKRNAMFKALINDFLDRGYDLKVNEDDIDETRLCYDDVSDALDKFLEGYVMRKEIINYDGTELMRVK